MTFSNTSCWWLSWKSHKTGEGGSYLQHSQGGIHLVKVCWHRCILKTFWLSRSQSPEDLIGGRKNWILALRHSDTRNWRWQEGEEEKRVRKMHKAAWEKPVGCWEENWALIHWTRESSTKGEFCKPASKFLLQKPVYVKLAHPFFICYYCCRHLFVRNDLAILKDMLMHGSQTATVGTPGCARIWNSTADADLV